MRLPRIAAVICASAMLAACGGGSDETAAPPPGPAPAPPTSATPPAPVPKAPLTGFPTPDEGARNRPLLTVKIDNHPEARPQFGIDKADVIVEEKVEGDTSRFMALFQSADHDRVGPVRSLRSTDPHWLRPLGGMISYSGGIDPVKNMLRPNRVHDIGADTHGPRFYKRRADRSFEHSMYVSTPVLRELTPQGMAGPPALFDFLEPGQPFTGVGAQPLSSVSSRMGGAAGATTFDWTWDAGAGLYRRGTDGRPHMIEGAGQIGMRNVIIQFTPYRGTPWRDRARSVVDEAVVTGEGEAWVLSAGTLVKGRWSRPNNDVPTAYTNTDGSSLRLQPGQTWVSLVPPGVFTETRA